MPNITPNSFSTRNVLPNGFFLSIGGSKQFRDLLLAKNLVPYKLDGVFSYEAGTIGLPIKLSDLTPVDTPNVSEEIFKEAKDELVMNKYGPGTKILDGADIISSDGTVSMQQAGTGDVLGGTSDTKQEYDQTDANIQLVNEFYIEVNAVVNRYVPRDGYLYSYVTTETIIPKTVKGAGGEYPNFEIPDLGFFNVLQGGAITLFDVDVSNLISNDSYLAQISKSFLADAFRERVDREIERATIGRVNLQAFSDPFSASLLVSGQQSLIAKNYTITVPDGVLDQASFLLQKFSGTYVPVSPIEGDYFTDIPKRFTKVGQLLQTVVNKVTKPTTPSNRSEKFLNNTGSGQKSVLFNNLGYNIYKPNYDENKTQVGIVIDQIFDKDNSIGNLYVPNVADIPMLNAPTGEVPYTIYGDETRTKVYGDDALSKQFESEDINRRNFGLSSLPYGEDSDIAGGFTWKSLQGPQPGALVGKSTNTQPDGEVLGTSPVYTGNVRDKLQSSLSTNFDYNPNSLLAKTQRIVESADLVKGGKRLTHAGNAINQISKIFNDGYKELTKGSRVRQFVNKNGAEVGQEYARIFTKDTPYLTFQNLQSGVANESGQPINGNIRKFTYSVVDSTYNLNIAPIAGNESTNIIPTRFGDVKKYMFSIENLAWRGTSEFYNLPLCERGPNGGRIMWFPPYDLSVGNESSTPRFNGRSFIGRPEPVYTYENTERTGQISWTILVDHPSISNILVRRELSKGNYSDNDVREIMASFFAGVKKYDIYDLARKYNTLKPETISEVYQQILESNSTSPEEKAQAVSNLPNSDNNPTSNQTQSEINEYVGQTFYFEEGILQEDINYEIVYETYNENSQMYILGSSNETVGDMGVFFNQVLYDNYENLKFLREKIIEIVTTNQGKVELTLNASRITTQNSNVSVSDTWYESAKLFFAESQTGDGKTLGDYLGKSFILKKGTNFAQTPTVTTKINSSSESFDCAYSQTANVYSFNSSVCRAVFVENIIFTPQDPTKNLGNQTEEIDQTGTKDKTPIDLTVKLRGISKKIIRELLTECNYFDAIKETDSFLFESIKSKFKFFNPAFHSMTPEGLNSRLVFLNQCVRPGRTIPTKSENPEDTGFSDSFNTNFGTPPVLVLRVGDFYNTKIIPDTLTFSYDETSPWDMNPEGIGFQPMVVRVTLGFKMIGGHGLAEPVEKLQNALSFNYYANTEMYDERADATESTEAIDKALIESIYNAEPIPEVKNVNDVSDFGNPFGIILSASQASGDTPSTAVQDGEIEYTQLFNGFVEQVKNYMSSVTTMFTNFCNEYNFGLWTQINHTRNFSQGYYDSWTSIDPNKLINIYGKPANWQEYIVTNGDLLIQAISENQDRLIKSIDDSINFTNQVINKVKTNYISYVQKTVSNNFNDVSSFIQTSEQVQVELVKSMSIMDFIAYSGDGKTLTDGSLKIYSLTGKTEGVSNTLDDFKTDYSAVAQSIQDYYTYWEGILFMTPQQTTGQTTTYDGFVESWVIPSDKYVYILLSNTILSTEATVVEKFIDELVKDIDNPSIRGFVEQQVDDWKTIFQTERDGEKEEIDSLVNGPTNQDFINFNPRGDDGAQLAGKSRVMTFKTGQGNDILESAFRAITSSSDFNNSLQLFNGKKQFNG